MVLWEQIKSPTGRATIHAGSYVRVTKNSRQSFPVLVAVAVTPSTHSILPAGLAALPVGHLFANDGWGITFAPIRVCVSLPPCGASAHWVAVSALKSLDLTLGSLDFTPRS